MFQNFQHKMTQKRAVECCPAQTIDNESYCPLWIRISGKVTKLLRHYTMSWEFYSTGIPHPKLNDVLVMTLGDQSISELKFIKYTQMLVFWWCCRVRCDSTKFWRKLVSWICFEVEQMFCVSQSSISDTFVSYSSALKCHVTFQSLVVDISKGLYRKATTSHSHLHFKLDGMDFLCQKSLDHLWAWLVHWLWDVLLAWYMIFI
jgi:hypothetical protein